MDEITFENLNELCRICATKTDLTVRIKIFETKNNEKQVHNRISACLPIQVTETDELPKIICTECYYKLDFCITFRNKSLRTDRLLKNILNTRSEREKGTNNNQNLDITRHLNDPVFNTRVEIEDERNNWDCNRQESVFLNAIKIEPSEIVDINTIKFSCDLCPRVFNNRENYVKHYEEHLSKCLSCAMYFPSNEDLQTHRNEMHSHENPELVKIESNENCDKNNKTGDVEDKEVVIEDENGSRIEKLYNCNMCDERFWSKIQFEQHTAKHLTMELGNDDDDEDMLPEISETVKLTENPNFLSEKSKKCYEKAYNDFKKWCDNKNIKEISENILLSYFEERSKTLKCSSLWSIYSMLKSILSKNDNIDIKQFTKLVPYLKDKSVGFRSVGTKTFTKQQIDKFIREAPDVIYLMKKVTAIIGICGACRINELILLTVDDIEDKGSVLIIKIINSETRMERTFIITDLCYIELYRKYASLRPAHSTSRRFFLQYSKGRCLNQVVGKNKIGMMPSEIAQYLKLPDPEAYTGHCFRQTSANLLAGAGTDGFTFKRSGGWKRFRPTKWKQCAENNTS